MCIRDRGTLLGDETGSQVSAGDAVDATTGDEPGVADEVPASDAAAAPVIDPGDADIVALVEEANDAFTEAQRLFALSEFAEYGKQLELLEDALRRLQAALNAQ